MAERLVETIKNSREYFKKETETRAEIQALFELLDRDGDGTIVVDEVW